MRQHRNLVCSICITIIFLFAVELMISSLVSVSDNCNDINFCAVGSIKIQFLFYLIICIIMAAISSIWGLDFKKHFRKLETRFFLGASISTLMMLVMICLYQSGHNLIQMPQWSINDPEMQKEYILWKLISGLVFVTKLIDVIACIFLFYKEADYEDYYREYEANSGQMVEIVDYPNTQVEREVNVLPNIEYHDTLYK